MPGLVIADRGGIAVGLQIRVRHCRVSRCGHRRRRYFWLAGRICSGIYMPGFLRRMAEGRE